MRHFLTMRKDIPRYAVHELCDGRHVWIAPRVSVQAKSRLTAQRVFHLLIASLNILDGSNFYEPSFDLAIPRNRKQLEDLEPSDLLGLEFNDARSSVALGCEVAAAVSRKRVFTYTAFKLCTSYGLASTHWKNLHPRYHPKTFGTSVSPRDHVLMASAITLAYSAIEELQLEPRSIAGKPVKTVAGGWDEKALKNLMDRLQRAGVNVQSPIVWNRRGSKTRIHKADRAANGAKQPWTRGIVRDRAVSIEDALLEASWLRSKCATHKYQKSTSSISMYDVTNVQHLARRLLLERCRIWPRLGTP
jgi:hypothetical protein